MANQAVKIVSPAGVAAPYPKITNPDSYENGPLTYKAGLILDPSEEGVQDFLNSIEDAAEKVFRASIGEIEESLKGASGKQIATLNARKENLKMHVPFGPDYNEDGTESGKVVVRFKRNAEGVYRSGPKQGQHWSASVPVFDAAKKELTEADGVIGGGSVLRIQAEVAGFNMAATSMAGVSLRIAAVQVIEMSSYGSGGASAFDIEEGGYQASEVERVAAKEEEAPVSTEDDSGDF